MNHKITWDPPSTPSDLSGIRVFRISEQAVASSGPYFEITSGFSTVKITVSGHWATYDTIDIMDGRNMGGDPSINHWDGYSPVIYLMNDNLRMSDLTTLTVVNYNSNSNGISAQLTSGDGSELVPATGTITSQGGGGGSAPSPVYYKQDFLDGKKVGTVTDFLHTRCFVEDKNVPAGTHTYGIIGYNAGGYGPCVQTQPHTM